MARDDFNPDPFKGINSPSFLGASRGSKAASARQFVADTSGAVEAKNTAELVQGVGGLATSLFGYVDKEYQEGIKETIQEEHENVLNEFGVRERTNLEVEAGTQTPPQIEGSKKELERMAKAQRHGQLSNSAYWARMNSVVRQLRAKYPAYRDQIDSMVSGITGATPANALRKAIMSENAARDRAARGSDPAKDRRRLVESNLAHISPSVLRREGTDEALGTNELRIHIAESKQRETAFDTGKQKLAFEKAQNKSNREKATVLANREVSTRVSHVLSSITGTDSEFGALMQRAQKTLEENGRINNADRNEILNGFRLLKKNALLATDSTLAEYTKISNMTPADRKAIRDETVTRLEIIEKALTDGQFGILTNEVNQMNAMKNGDDAALLNNPNLRTLAAVKRVQGENMANILLMGDMNKYGVQGSYALDRTLGQGVALRTEFQNQKMQGNDKPEFRADMIKSAVETLTSPKATPEGIAMAATSLYGQKNIGFLSTIAPENRARVFSELTSQKVADKMWEMRSVNPKLWEDYEKWTLDSFQALNRGDATVANEIVVNRKFINLKFNAKKGQFEVKGTDEAINRLDRGNVVGALSDAVESAYLEPNAREAINRLNSGLRGLLPVLEKSGGEPGEAIGQVVKLLGIDLNAPKVGPDIEVFWKYVMDLMKPAPEGLRGSQ